MAIVCKSASEIEKMRRSGGIVREVLNHVKAMVAPGVTTMDLEKAAEAYDRMMSGKARFRVVLDIAGK